MCSYQGGAELVETVEDVVERQAEVDEFLEEAQH